MDQRLAAIGCKLVLLTASEETIWERTIKEKADSQFLSEYALKFGRTHQELHAHFVGEQIHFKSMFDQSAMPKILIQNDGELKNILGQAYDFWVSQETILSELMKSGGSG